MINSTHLTQIRQIIRVGLRDGYGQDAIIEMVMFKLGLDRKDTARRIVMNQWSHCHPNQIVGNPPSFKEELNAILTNQKKTLATIEAARKMMVEKTATAEQIKALDKELHSIGLSDIDPFWVRWGFFMEENFGIQPKKVIKPAPKEKAIISINKAKTRRYSRVGDEVTVTCIGRHKGQAALVSFV